MISSGVCRVSSARLIRGRRNTFEALRQNRANIFWHQDCGRLVIFERNFVEKLSNFQIWCFVGPLAGHLRFKLSTWIFEGSLANKIRFDVFHLHV